MKQSKVGQSASEEHASSATAVTPAPVSNAAAQEELGTCPAEEQDSTLDMAASGSGQGTAPPPEDAEGGGGGAWLMGMLAQFSPDLAAVVDEGFVGAFEGDLMAALESALDLDTAGGADGLALSLSEAIGTAAGTIVGAASGDQTCCSAMDGWLQGFQDQAAGFVTGGSYLAQLSTLVSGGMTNTLSSFGAMLDESVIVDKISGTIENVGARVQGWIDNIYGVNQTLGDEVAAYFGLESSSGGLVGLIIEQVAAWSARLTAGISEAIDTVLEFLFSFSALDSLHDIVDFALEMRDGMAWLQANWGAEDMWEQAATLQSELPVFYELLVGGKSKYDMLRNGLLAGASDTVAILDGWTASVTGLPLASGAIELVTSISEMVTSVVQSPIWGEIGGALATAAEYGFGVIRFLIDAAVATVWVLASPIAILPVLVGGTLRLLPDCYREPIYDLFITLAAGGLSLAMLPIAAVMPIAAPAIQAGLEGVLEGMLSLHGDDKEAMLIRVGELLSAGYVDELLGGFVVGVVDGVIDEVVGVFQLLKMLVVATNPATYVLMAVQALAAMALDAAESFDDLGDRGKGEDEYAPVESEPDVGAEPPEIPVPVPGGDDWGTLEELLGGLVAQFESHVSEAMAGHAQDLALGLLDTATEGPYAVGFGVGWLTGWALVQLAIAAATMGIGELVTVGKAAVQGIVAAFRGGFAAFRMAIVAAMAASKSFIDDAARMLRGLGEQFGKVAQWLQDAWGAVWKWVDELIEGLKGKPKKAKPDAEIDPVTGKPKPKPKPRGGGEEDDDTPLKKLARKEARDGWAEFQKGDDMVSVPAADAILEKEVVDKKDGVQFTVDPDLEGNDWAVRVGATEPGSRSEYVEEGTGWVATDGSAKFLAAEDKTVPNADRIDEVLDELEESWQALVDEDPQKAMGDAGSEAAAAYAKDAKFYERMLLVASFSDFGEEEVTATVRIAPNEQEKSRPLRRSSGLDLVQRFSDSGDLPNAHMEAAPDLVEGLGQLKDVDPKTWDEALTAMRDAGEANKGGLVQLKPWKNASAFQVFGMEEQADRAFVAAIENYGPDDVLETKSERQEWLGYRKGNLHGRKGGFAKSLDAIQAEIATGSKEAVADRTLEHELGMKLDGNKDLAARLEVYKAIAVHFDVTVAYAPASPLTEGELKKYRDALKKAAIPVIGGSVADADRLIVKSAVFDGESGLKGSFFEAWLQWAWPKVYAVARPVFLPTTSNTLTQRRIADGYIDGSLTSTGGTLYDGKGYTQSSTVDEEQVRAYAEIVESGVACVSQDMSGQVFDVVRYVFPSMAAARASKDVLFQHLNPGRLEVFVGNVDVTANL